MNRQKMCIVAVCLSLLVNTISFAEENLRVLPETVNGVKPADMMKHYLLSQAQQQFERWKEDYEQRKTPEQIAEYQKNLRGKFMEAIGPFPRRTPLKPNITGEIHRNGYKVEKIIFESQPKHYVSAILFLPDSRKHKMPYPGVLVPCGHSRNGKASEAYQTMGALLALNGMAAMVFDPIDQGERNQMLSELPQLWGTRAHTMLGVGSILLGRNTAWFEIWDGMRGIDYLQSRPEIDSKRIGCTGNSGGGTQTSYLMSLDKRIVAAAPSCYITSFERLLSTIGPQDAEQNIFGQLAFGMDHADYIMMRAPKPTIICAATKDFFDIQGVWDSFRYAKRLYTRMGFAERIDLLENDASHNYNRLQRQGVVRWMARWLLKKDEPITEPEIKLLSDEEIKCTPTGQVMKLQGARSTYDLNRDYEKKLARQRQRAWKNTSQSKLLNQIRRITGIRKLKELPEPKVELPGVIERDSYFIKKMNLRFEEGVYLPALMFLPKQTDSKGVVLYINEKGKNEDAGVNGSIEKLVKAGRSVLSVDVRGTGETGKTSGGTLSKATGFDWKNGFTAYLLGRSYVAMRAEDILTCARFLHQQNSGPVDIVALGHACVPALHAAALEPDLFDSVKLIRGLASWSDVIESGLSVNQFVNTVHGALKVYDLPNLVETLGDKITIEKPLNALGKPGAANLPGTGDDTGRTVVYRDTWGVPHIYAPTMEAGMYAMGWTQAEDRPEELLKNFLRALGESARFDGPKAIQSDTVSHLWDHYGTSKRYFDRNRPEIREQIRAFVKGINDFYASHSEDIPSWWGKRKVDEYMVVAFSRLFLYSWSIGQAFGDLQSGGIQPGFDEEPRGSNQWAVSPKRSAEGSAILLIDPHLSWWGPSRFWEFRIHAGELNGSGFTLAGVPSIGLGHNADVGWAMTTGGPDTADVYELKIKEDDPTKYLYDGQWRSLTQHQVTIEVKGAGSKKITLWYSHHGPIVAMRKGKAYAAKIAYADEVQVSEAWHEFNTAIDYRGAVKAMRTRQLFPQNVMVADTSGNIYYQRTGRVPRRPSGYNWSKPVDGSTSATEWKGLHPASDHIQVLNPPQGYMQNCNISPDVMMVDSPFSPEETLPYIYGSSGGRTNQRGSRAVQLLQSDSSVTIKEALSYAVDVHPYGVERWLEVIKQADSKFGDVHRLNSDYMRGINDILSWDGELRRDSTAALKYYYWHRQIIEDHGAEAVSEAARRIDYYLEALGERAPEINLSDDELGAALDSFSSAMAKLKTDHGSLNAAYGDTFRVGRDEVSWPVGGGGGRGLTTLRNISYGPERKDHTRWGRSGQTSTQIVVLSKPIRSWTYVPIGQSDRANSAHYRDQAEKLFSLRKLKPTWWLPKYLVKHIKSRTVLTKAR